MERILIVFAVLFGFAHASIAQGEYEQSVLFTNVMVWDGTSKALRKADVLVSGSKIAEISARVNPITRSVAKSLLRSEREIRALL